MFRRTPIAARARSISRRLAGACLLAASTPAVGSAQQIVGSTEELVAALAAANAGEGDPEILLEDGLYALDRQLWMKADGITVRGRRGAPERVVLQGEGMTGGLTHAFQVAAHDVTIADLTVRQVANHAVQIHGEPPASADRTVLRNLVLQDCGEQIVKVSYDKRRDSSSEGGRIEGCRLEYTAGIGPQYYIGGVDAHHAKDWVVRGCTFRGIRSPESRVAEHAIHFWSGSEGTLVERNVIVNCDRAIGFGLGNRGHGAGIIRNNMIWHADLGADRGDAALWLESARGVLVCGNTIVQEHACPTAILVQGRASDVHLANNLILANGRAGRIIRERDRAVVRKDANVLDARLSWFVSPSDGDLHLAAVVPELVGRGVVLAELGEDFDGTPRPGGAPPTIGAHELGTGTSP